MASTCRIFTAEGWSDEPKLECDSSAALATAARTFEATYVFPFLAHALGTLVGAFVAARLPARSEAQGLHGHHVGAPQRH